MSELIESWNTATKEELELYKKFINGLRNHPDIITVDELANELDSKVSRQINCLDCGNCCRNSVTDFNEEDVNRVSKHLGLSKKQFVAEYLIDDFGTYITKTTPCPFLNLVDNKCLIYEVRPHVCQSFPHTNRPKFTKRSKAHIGNLKLCPITFNIVSQMYEALSSD